MFPLLNSTARLFYQRSHVWRKSMSHDENWWCFRLICQQQNPLSCQGKTDKTLHEWKSNINNSEFRDTLDFEHIQRAWVFHSCVLSFSINNFYFKICYYYLLLFCSLFHAFSFSFTSQSLIPSTLPPLSYELCILALPYTCKKRLNRLLIYTWDLGINSWIEIMGLGSSCSLRDVDLGKRCCSAVWFPLWEESFSRFWGQNCGFLPESLNFFSNKKQAPKHTLLDSSELKIACLTAMHKRN